MREFQSQRAKGELSLMAHYYIRRLLHQRRDRLCLVAAPGRNLFAAEDADLNAVVEGLYLDDVRIERVVNSLESYAQMHRRLVAKESVSSGISGEVEQRIFALLGLRLEEPLVLV